MSTALGRPKGGRTERALHGRGAVLLNAAVKLDHCASALALLFVGALAAGCTASSAHPRSAGAPTTEDDTVSSAPSLMAAELPANEPPPKVGKSQRAADPSAEDADTPPTKEGRRTPRKRGSGFSGYK